MARLLSDTLADPTLPEAVLAELERLNEEAAPLHIWLRTRANQPLQRPWHEAAREPVPEPSLPGKLPLQPGALRVLPHVWKWTQIEPYLHRIAEIAPLAFTERQQFLLTNPGLMGALRVTNTIRIAISIYKPGDQAPQRLHTPSASRTILSEAGGYTLVEGERCIPCRGDLILTPAGTWHGHGNDDKTPVVWMDVLDWPLLEYLDVIWIRHDGPGHGGNMLPPETDYSQRPANMWRRHVNLDAAADALLYSLTDEPLLKAIGQYRAQGHTAAGEVVDVTG